MRRARIWLALACVLAGLAAAERVPQSHNRDARYDDPTTSRSLSEQQFDEQVQVSNYITVAGLTLYAWEYLRTLPRELYMYRPRMIRRPQVILFLLIRYGTIPALILPAYSLWHHFSKNGECPHQEQITVAVVQFLVACIFSWRTIAIWRRRRWVVIFLVVFSLALFAASIGLLYKSQDAVTITGACRPSVDRGERRPDMMQHPINTVKWFYLISMIFDTITMLLSSYKLIYYANMGRKLDAPLFNDPFEVHRQQQREKEKASAATPNDEQSSRRSSAGEALKKMQGQLVPVAMFPYRIVRAAMHWWSTLSPLLARLIANGFVYFFVATAFNVVNFVLEEVNSIHSKSFLTLYPPLMCVLCQTMILTEFDAVWSSYNPDLDIPGRRFVDRVVGIRDEDRSRVSELDRFQEFVTALEDRQASMQSPTSRKLSTVSPKAVEPFGPYAPDGPDTRRPSQVSFTPRRRGPSLDAAELSPRTTPTILTNPALAAVARADGVESRRPSQVSFATNDRMPSVDMEVSPCASPPRASPRRPSPRHASPAPAPAPTEPAPAPRSMSPTSSTPLPPPPPAAVRPDAARMPQLSPQQQQQALRMAGLR